MKPRAAGLGIGIVFGVVLAWSGMTSPVIIRQALLFQRGYLFLFFASAVLVAATGVSIVSRLRLRALFTGATVTVNREMPRRRHIVGSLIFGLGWAISDACPGPIATQIGQGIGWAVFTLTGVVIGVYVYLKREQPETEPPTDSIRAVPEAVTGLR